jgi:hypothetical protein
VCGKVRDVLWIGGWFERDRGSWVRRGEVKCGRWDHELGGCARGMTARGGDGGRDGGRVRLDWKLTERTWLVGLAGGGSDGVGRAVLRDFIV